MNESYIIAKWQQWVALDIFSHGMFMVFWQYLGIIDKISHENFKSTVLMHSHVSITSLGMLLGMLLGILSELALEYLIMIDSLSLCLKESSDLISVCLI